MQRPEADYKESFRSLTVGSLYGSAIIFISYVYHVSGNAELKSQR